MNAELQYAVTEVSSSPQETSAIPGGREIKMGNALKDIQGKNFVIVASELVPTLESKWGVKLAIKKKFPGSALENCRSVIVSYGIGILSFRIILNLIRQLFIISLI